MECSLEGWPMFPRAKWIGTAGLLILLAPATSFSQSTPSYWTEGTVIGVHNDSANKLVPIFVNSFTGVGSVTPYTGWLPNRIFPRGEWVEVDISQYVPSDATAAFLSGIMIITGDTVSTIKDLHISFRPVGATIGGVIYQGKKRCDVDSNGNRITSTALSGQATISLAHDTVRSSTSAWVPLNGGKFEFCWSLGPNDTNSAAQNTMPSYGVSLQLQAFARAKRATD